MSGVDPVLPSHLPPSLAEGEEGRLETAIAARQLLRRWTSGAANGAGSAGAAASEGPSTHAAMPALGASRLTRPSGDTHAHVEASLDGPRWQSSASRADPSAAARAARDLVVPPSLLRKTQSSAHRTRMHSERVPIPPERPSGASAGTNVSGTLFSSQPLCARSAHAAPTASSVEPGGAAAAAAPGGFSLSAAAGAARTATSGLSSMQLRAERIARERLERRHRQLDARIEQHAELHAAHLSLQRANRAASAGRASGRSAPRVPSPSPAEPDGACASGARLHARPAERTRPGSATARAATPSAPRAGAGASAAVAEADLVSLRAELSDERARVDAARQQEIARVERKHERERMQHELDALHLERRQIEGRIEARRGAQPPAPPLAAPSAAPALRHAPLAERALARSILRAWHHALVASARARVLDAARVLAERARVRHLREWQRVAAAAVLERQLSVHAEHTRVVRAQEARALAAWRARVARRVWSALLALPAMRRAEEALEAAAAERRTQLARALGAHARRVHGADRDASAPGAAAADGLAEPGGPEAQDDAVAAGAQRLDDHEHHAPAPSPRAPRGARPAATRPPGAHEALPAAAALSSPPQAAAARAVEAEEVTPDPPATAGQPAAHVEPTRGKACAKALARAQRTPLAPAAAARPPSAAWQSACAYDPVGAGTAPASSSGASEPGGAPGAATARSRGASAGAPLSSRSAPSAAEQRRASAMEARAAQRQQRREALQERYRERQRAEEEARLEAERLALEEVVRAKMQRRAQERVSAMQRAQQAFERRVRLEQLELARVHALRALLLFYGLRPWRTCVRAAAARRALALAAGLARARARVLRAWGRAARARRAVRAVRAWVQLHSAAVRTRPLALTRSWRQLARLPALARAAEARARRAWSGRLLSRVWGALRAHWHARRGEQNARADVLHARCAPPRARLAPTLAHPR